MRARFMLLLVLGTLRATGAYADELGPDEEIALRHFQAGAARYEAHDYPAALAEFEVARRYKPTPAFDFNIARCLDRLERAQEAIAAYERYLDSHPADEQQVRERLTRLRLLASSAAAASVARPGLGGKSIAAITIGVGTLGFGAAATGLFVATKVDADGRTSGCCSASVVDALDTRQHVAHALFGIAAAGVLVDVVLVALVARERGLRTRVARAAGAP